MAIDPLTSLAMTMQSNKGVYALLLGSGISRAAGVPTGWEVLLDLITRIAAARGETAGADPAAWYSKQEGKPPNYSTVLDNLTRSSAERMGLLRSYFEPSEEERASGQKAPTEAHKAIASLVAGGFVRVIVTTNFDGLLEQALRTIGVNPSVISTSAAAQGAIPLVHSPCTVVKVNGDYLDPELKNTESELSSYSEATAALLDRIFDEYGLIVCGWSVEWDHALRLSLERCRTRRYGTYWTAYGDLSAPARRLADFRQAVVMPIRGADDFFRELTDRVRALEDLLSRDSVSSRVAVARLKRYLSSGHQISANDLLRDETERVVLSISADRYPLQSASLTPETLTKRLRSYESEVEILLSLVAAAARWCKKEEWAMLSDVLRRIGDEDQSLSGLSALVGLRRYPAHLLLYGAGIVAAAQERYGLLAKLLRTPIRAPSHEEPGPAVDVLHTFMVLEPQKGVITGKERHHTPLSDHVFEVLREVLRDYLPGEKQYDSAFQWFEYLFGLSFVALNTSSERAQEILRDESGREHIWHPIGRYSWNGMNRAGLEGQAQISGPNDISPLAGKLIRAGFYDGDGGRGSDVEWCMAIHKGMESFRHKIAGRFW